MRKITLAIVLSLAIILSTAGIAGAVTDGELDGSGHPYVVLLLMEIGGQPAFRCSGTLLSPTVLLTAGHCTNDFPDEPYSGIRVFTEFRRRGRDRHNQQLPVRGAEFRGGRGLGFTPRL